MSRKIPIHSISFILIVLVVIAVFAFWAPDSHAYQRYNSGCQTCHGSFTGSTSPKGTTFPSGSKHEMHRAASAMNTDCNLCHTSGDNRNPFLKSSDGLSGIPGLGCTGCHNGNGLRAHHAANGVTVCSGCHPAGTVPPENTPPPYYGTTATNANIPCNPLAQANVNENWSIGDFQGLDNDGDNQYDSNDSNCQVATAPQIGVAPASKNYGNVTVGSSSSQTFTVSNAGTADLIVSGMTLSDTTNFILATSGGSNTCGSATPTIAAGNNCTVSIAFSPQSAVSFNETFSIASNDTGNSPLDVPLTGNGVAPPTPTPNIAVTDSVAPGNDLQVPFGSITIGTTSDQTVTVTNNGTADLVIGAVASANPLAAPFSIQGNTCGQPIVPSATCTITVRFAPNSTAPASDSFDIPSDDPDTPTVTVSVSGTGSGAPAPDITVTDSVAPGNDLLAAFGNVLEGTTSDQTVTVTNDGTADLTIGTVVPPAAPFSIPSDACSGQILAPSASCTVSVRFAPTALGPANESFDIPSDDPDEPTVTVTVSGIGVANNPPAAPVLVIPADGATGVDPASVTFGWNRSTDADGDPVTYDLYLCPDDDTFATCPDPVNTTPVTAAADTKAGLAFAASGVGMIFFGIAFVPGIGRRRKAALLLVLALAAGMLLFACSDDDGTSAPRGQVSFTSTNLAAGTTYYWKVVATDGTDSTDSATRSFTTK